MKHVPDLAQEPERPRSLEELRCRLSRRVSDFREGWRRCDNSRCRRWKHCCGEGPEFTCTDDGRPRRTPSPEERAKAISDLYKEVKRRAAERVAGAGPPEEETPQKLRDEPRAVTRRKRKSAQASAAKRAADSTQANGAEAATPVVEETPLAPEQQARIDRAWNEYVAEQDRARERRPRITQL
ncbi:hypothetical protein [Bradyrhizobium sp.]